MATINKTSLRKFWIIKFHPANDVSDHKVEANHLHII